MSSSRSLGPIAAAVIAFVIGCAKPIETAVASANAIERNVEQHEEELAEICQAVELQAIEESDSERETAARIAAIHSKCAEAWEAYNEIKFDIEQLTDSVQANDLESVLHWLAEMVKDERRFIGLVEAIVGAKHGEQVE